MDSENKERVEWKGMNQWIHSDSIRFQNHTWNSSLDGINEEYDHLRSIVSENGVGRWKEKDIGVGKDSNYVDFGLSNVLVKCKNCGKMVTEDVFLNHYDLFCSRKLSAAKRAAAQIPSHEMHLKKSNRLNTSSRVTMLSSMLSADVNSELSKFNYAPNLENQCCVLDEFRNPCLMPIFTCRIHSLAARRKVTGRGKRFDAILKVAAQKINLDTAGCVFSFFIF